MAKIDIKKRAERNSKIRRTITKINQTVAKLESMKDEYLRRAVEAKSRGETASYNIAKNGLNITLTQIKRAREMLLNIEITSELQRMGETNAEFLTGMSTIAKSISKINKKSDFVKLQKEIEKALSGMEEAQAGLDGFLQSTDAAFAALSSAPGALSDSEIDRLIDGSVSEKELLMDAQIDTLMGNASAQHGAGSSARGENARVQVAVGGEPTPSDDTKSTTLIAKPVPAPTGAFDFSAKPSPAFSIDAFRAIDVASVRDVALADVIAPTSEFYAILGKDDDGEIVRLDLSRSPHILAGGMIGGGKSTFLHQLVCSLLLTHTAQELRLVLFDLKNEELGVYNGVAHLAADVVTNAEFVMPAMTALAEEMNRRYELFASLGVRNIDEYNKTDEPKLPYIFVAFDEFGDAIKVCGKKFETAYLSLVRQCAGAGIFTLLCTRTADKSVVTAGLRANSETCIAFKLATEDESKLILGASGAERIVGAGQLLCRNGDKITSARAPHISQSECRAVAAALKGDML